MNSRERLERCYRQQEIDRPAVYTRTAYPLNDPTYDELKKFMQMYTDHKKAWTGWRIDYAYKLEKMVKPYSSDYQRVITTMTTPKGKLTSSLFSNLTGKPNMLETHYIKDYDDALKYLSLPDADIIPGNPSDFFEEIKNMGDKGIIEVHLGLNPAGFVADLMGSENFAIMSITDRDIIYELCKKRMHTLIRAVKKLVENGIGPYFSMLGEEYIVPPMHGEKDFYDFNVQYDKPIIDLIHNAGGYVHIHCHGSIKKVLQGFVDMGADVLHPFEAPPMGDITASEAKKIIRNKICMEGNIQISHMYESTPDEIREEVTNLIHDAFDDGKGLIVCPTASPYIFGEGEKCFQQYKALVETVVNR